MGSISDLHRSLTNWLQIHRYAKCRPRFSYFMAQLFTKGIGSYVTAANIHQAFIRVSLVYHYFEQYFKPLKIISQTRIQTHKHRHVACLQGWNCILYNWIPQIYIYVCFLIVFQISIRKKLVFQQTVVTCCSLANTFYILGNNIFMTGVRKNRPI